MGKWFLSDNSATVGRILMIFSAHPHEISIPIKWWKNQPSSTSAMRNFPHRWEIPEKFRDQSALLGEHLSQKLPLPSPNNPIFSAKDVLFRVQKYLPKKCFLGFLSKGRLNLWARYAKPKTQINFFFSEPLCWYKIAISGFRVVFSTIVLRKIKTRHTLKKALLNPYTIWSSFLLTLCNHICHKKIVI